MGLDFNGLSFLLHERTRGVEFTTTATIGRQSLLARPWMLWELAKRNRLDWTLDELDALCATGYAQELLLKLGAKNVDSFDYSEYESASVIHDFNLPISNEYENRYDC